MSDFFREVDEELRNDRMKALWKNYSKIIIAVAVALIALTAGYRYYLYWNEQSAGAAGDKYLQALSLIENGDREGGRKLLDELSNEGWGGYPFLAKLRAAATLLGDGNTQQAMDAFDSFAADGSAPDDLRDYARLQAAMAAVDIETYDEVVKRTETLVLETNPWRYLAREALALSAWKSGDLKTSAEWVQDLKISSDIPPGLRQRLQILEDLIISRGGKLPTPGESG